jgi:hypothetical protein
VLRIRCDFGDGISSFFVSWEDNRFGGALGMADRLGGARHGVSLGFDVSLWFRLTVVIPPWRSVGQTLSAVITWC